MATASSVPSVPALSKRAAGVSGRRNPAAAWRHLDLALATAVVGIAGFGVLMVYSASRDKLQAAGTDPAYYLKRQAAFVIAGAVVMVIAAAIDYRKLRDFANVFYGGTVFLLLAVFCPAGS